MATISPSLVILSCSRRKKRTSRPIPAIDRYDGPLFQVLRKHIRERPEVPPATYVLSGRFGLIDAEFPTPRYSHRLTAADIPILQNSVDSQIKKAVEKIQPASVFVSVGSQYWPLLDESLSREFASEKLIIASGSIGGRASQLAHWLRLSEPRTNNVPIGQPCGKATLLGTTVRLTPSEILCNANEARSVDPEGALRFQTWFVELGNERVAPKWLASILFDKPVFRFRTSDARRVLTDLGLSIRHVAT
ncbi:MAG TPA: hypothetical protein VFP64_12815 [Pyrinomonadaceae bacterium]|nr:hypothetical protein [Pyrinomonadaceae bacterium]